MKIDFLLINATNEWLTIYSWIDKMCVEWNLNTFSVDGMMEVKRRDEKSSLESFSGLNGSG